MFNNPLIFNGNYKVQDYNGIQFIWVNIPTYNPASVRRFWSMLVFTYRVLRLPKKILSPANWLLVSSMPIFPFLVIKRLRAKWRIEKVIFEIRDMWPETPIYLMGYSQVHPFIMFLRWLQKRALKISDGVASLLPDNKEYLESLAKKPLQWCYLPNGVQVEDHHEPIDVYSKLKNLNGKFITCYAGTIGYANALDVYIELIVAMKDQQDFHFLFVGDGYLKEKYQKQLSNYENVTFISKIPKLAVPTLLELVDLCFISWHRSELYNFGVSANKYFDYMMSGKPVLVSSQGFTDPVKLSGGGSVVTEIGVEPLKAELQKFGAMSVAERKDIGQLGRKYVLEHHTFSGIANNYLEFLNRC